MTPAADAGSPIADERLPMRQTVFFVRHAESRWNRAQADYALMSMMWENDHGLTQEGRLQAEELRRRLRSARECLEAGDVSRLGGEVEGKWLQQLVNPDAVFSSPFTRAVCTSCIALRDLVRRQVPMVLIKEARESKNFGGADSTGVAVGEEIRDRVEEELRALYEEEEAPLRDAALKDFSSLPLDVSDVSEPWWGGYLGDAEDHLNERVDALMSRLRGTRGNLPCGGGSTVLVGHSLFFRTVFARYLGGRDAAQSSPSVEESLQQYVLPFCGVVGATLEWDEAGNCCIVDARPLLGTQLKIPTMIAPPISGDVGGVSPGPRPMRHAPLLCACGRHGESCLPM